MPNASKEPDRKIYHSPDEYYSDGDPRLGDSSKQVYQAFQKACGEYIAGTEVVAYDMGARPILYYAWMHDKLVITSNEGGDVEGSVPVFRDATEKEIVAFHNALDHGELQIARLNRPGKNSPFAKVLHEATGMEPLDVLLEFDIKAGEPVSLALATELGVKIPTSWTRKDGILRPPADEDKS